MGIQGASISISYTFEPPNVIEVCNSSGMFLSDFRLHMGDFLFFSPTTSTATGSQLFFSNNTFILFVVFSAWLLLRSVS